MHPESELNKQLSNLQNDNRNLHEKLELITGKLEKLENILEKKLNCQINNEEILNLFKQWTTILKAEFQNSKITQLDTIQSSENSSSSDNFSSSESKNYNSHFDCIANCENFTQFPKTCSEALNFNRTGDGIYQIYLPNTDLKVFSTFCLQDSLGDNAWIIIQRRQLGIESFTRNWTDYKYGFGDLNSDYWLGLERIHALTKSGKYELWIQLKDQNNIGHYANYNEFAIESEDQWYKLSTLGEYSGNADNILSYDYESNFSTYDQDNDANDHENCAEKRMSGWWFKDCEQSNLNGVYNSINNITGINWIGWNDYRNSLKYVHMAIRPVSVDLIQRTQMLFSFKNQTVYEYNNE